MIVEIHDVKFNIVEDAVIYQSDIPNFNSDFIHHITQGDIFSVLDTSSNILPTYESSAKSEFIGWSEHSYPYESSNVMKMSMNIQFHNEKEKDGYR